jgi:hypothetical protein
MRIDNLRSWVVSGEQNHRVGERVVVAPAICQRYIWVCELGVRGLVWSLVFFFFFAGSGAKIPCGFTHVLPWAQGFFLKKKKIWKLNFKSVFFFTFQGHWMNVPEIYYRDNYFKKNYIVGWCFYFKKNIFNIFD